MNGRMRPIGRSFRITMFDWIEVNIVHVSLQIGFVAHKMFPVASLPDTAFAFGDPRGTSTFAGSDAPRESGLDMAPAERERIIARRQRPQAMQMIGKHDDCIDAERARLARRMECTAQFVNALSQQTPSPFGDSDSKENKCRPAPRRVDSQEYRQYPADANPPLSSHHQTNPQKTPHRRVGLGPPSSCLSNRHRWRNAQ